MALVDYLVARECVPERRGLAYDYILAGDGLFIATENAFMEARIPVAPAQVRGLTPVFPSFSLRSGRIPLQLWEEMAFLAGVFCVCGREVLFSVGFDVDGGYRLQVPEQIIGPERIVYRPSPGAVLQIHSHHRYPARFSPTDDADEGGLCIYGVIGRLDTERPEVALRVGAYGHFLPLQWDAMFEGEKGAFRDAHFEPVELPTNGEDGDGLQD